MSDDFEDDFELDGDTDLGDVPTSKDPIAGTYLCTIVKMEKKTQKKDSDKSYINVQFRIDDCLAETHEAFIGRNLFDIFNLGKEALWKIKGLVIAAKGEDAAKGNRIPNLTDCRVKLDAYIDTYGGSENLRTRKYKSAEGWVGINLDLTADDETPPADGEGEKEPPKDAKASGAKDAKASSTKAGGKSTKGSSSGEVEI